MYLDIKFIKGKEKYFFYCYIFKIFFYCNDMFYILSIKMVYELQFGYEISLQ